METRARALVDGVDQFIGIDHHKKTSYITIKDRQGEVIKRGNIDTRPDALSAFLKDGIQEEGAVRMAVLECGRTYRPMWRWLSEEVDEAVLAHPGGLKIISDTVYKDDKLDSGKLADLLMPGMIPRAHAASDEAWERRLTLRPDNCCRAGEARVNTSLRGPRENRHAAGRGRRGLHHLPRAPGFLGERNGDGLVKTRESHRHDQAHIARHGDAPHLHSELRAVDIHGGL